MKPLRASTLVAWLALAAGPAVAGGLTVSPPHVRLKPGQQTAEVRLANEGERAVTVQASAQHWRQNADGSEQESEAADFALYPKVFTVAPGKSQVVRVGRLPTAPTHPSTEVAYRLTLRELPVDDGSNPGINVTTRLRLPVWLLPSTPDPQWEVGALAPMADGLGVSIANRGNVHVRLVDVEYAAMGADGAVRQREVVPGWYVLAGAARTFPFKPSETFCKGATRISATVRTVDASRRAEWPASGVCERGV
jgi:fimbrial chaperone protein